MHKKDLPLLGGLNGHVGHPDPQQPESHKILNCHTTIVAVAVDVESTQTLVKTFCERISNKTITGLKANLGLEGVLTDGTNHLEGNIRTIEQTCVIR
jgi:hypothetical protein